MRKNFRFWLVLVLCTIPAYFHGIFQAKAWMGTADLTFGDFVDQEIIVQGLEGTKTFAQALHWWVGPWVGGDGVPFYRPLTSLVWWLEFQAFGASRHSQSAMVSFMAVHWVSHFVVCLLLAALLRRLVGGRIAILTVVLWASCALEYVSLPVPVHALSNWKDSPDVWVSGAIILSLWALLSFLCTGEKRFVVFTFLAQLLAISFKEHSYVLPFMAALLVWFERDRIEPARRRVWSMVGAMFVIVAVAYGFRYLALGGPGFRFGTNGSWPERFLLNVGGGKAMNRAAIGDTAALALALFTVAVVLFCQHKRRVALGLTGLSAVGVLLADYWRGEAGATLFRLLQPLYSLYWYSSLELYQMAFHLALLISIAMTAWKRRDRRVLFAWGWAFAAYLPLLTAPITEHALYLGSIGWALLWAIALDWCLAWFASRYRAGNFRYGQPLSPVADKRS